MAQSEHVLKDYRGNYPVAPKVKWSALVASLLGVVLPWIMSALGDPQLVTGVPDWVVVIVSGLILGGGTFGAGFGAKHQSRDDLPRANGGVDPSGGQVG